MKRVNLIASSFAFCASLVTIAAHAHQVWLEQDAGSIRFYFGEFEASMREASPGLLDKMGMPVVTQFSAQGERQLKMEKTGTAYVASGSADKNESIIAESRYPIYESKANPKAPVRTLWIPAARYITSFAEQSPKLVMDLVSTGKSGEFKLFFKGQPLAKTKVTVMAPFGWVHDAYTDNDGKVTVSFPWKGNYLLNASLTEKMPGERDGEKYDEAIYSANLSLTQAEGLAPPPVPQPGAKPNH
jgi:Domain of unknown function (DUF4198)